MSKPRPDMPPFGEADLRDDPIELFAAWFERAAAELPLAEAVCLATVDGDGLPDARMVLLKGFDERGFRFFTNEESAKGAQLAARPAAALAFYWRELDRQVRVRGPVERLDPPESDEYFATRERASRIGAWASPQSRPIAGREELDRSVAEVEARFADAEVQRPPHWGGFRVVPETVEFWQGQVGRLHDRFRYERAGDSWNWTRLAP
ncbi:MAG TPA: pyridoxamine 5'-phosphate oxidase [Solirubrobacterales bacterium]|nr:pyridoxamine 5'-phosphate oxidase [Solirubrobacterales bacterium]